MCMFESTPTFAQSLGHWEFDQDAGCWVFREKPAKVGEEAQGKGERITTLGNGENGVKDEK